MAIAVSCSNPILARDQFPPPPLAPAPFPRGRPSPSSTHDRLGRTLPSSETITPRVSRDRIPPRDPTVFRIYLRPRYCPESEPLLDQRGFARFRFPSVSVSAFRFQRFACSWSLACVRLKLVEVEVVHVTKGLWRANTELVIGWSLFCTTIA